MKVVSLFSGGGLGDLGFVMAGCEIVAQVEIDEYCQKILSLRYPDAKKFRDIKTVRGSDLPKCDIITGGFPCTDISIANNDPKGLAGERSGLWGEQRRIIGEVRPKYALVENVTALFIRGIDTVIGDLATLGYDSEWTVIPSAWHGAPHLRERVWILAYPKGFGRKAFAFKGKFDTKDRCKKPEQWKLLQSISSGAYHIDERWKAFESDICGDDDGSPDDVDRLQVLGNGQMPFTTRWIAERIIEWERTIA